MTEVSDGERQAPGAQGGRPPVLITLDPGASAAETARIVPGVLGERAEVLGALAMVLRDSDRFLSSQLRLAAGPR